MNRIGTGVLFILLLIIITSCQGVTEFIPPDLEERIWVNAILNDSREQNFIIIEKSFQREYPDEKTKLENLSVTIKSESKVVFDYFNPESENRSDTVYLPPGLKFIPGQKFTLTVSEKNTKEVSSEITVPPTPSDPQFTASFIQTFLPPPFECHNPVKSLIMEILFKSEKDQFYYIDIESYSNTSRYQVDYEIIESNSSYFKTFIHGFRSIGFRNCHISDMESIPFNFYQPFFFNGRTIPEDTCRLKIKIDLIKYYYDYKRPFIIYVNSIPADFYYFEKNYHTYYENLFDPFSEPVFLKGNIKGGFGIFTICSSKYYSLIINDL